MNRPILVACLAVVAVAGCTRTYVRETVAERPVVREQTVVEKPVVVERPVVRETVIERPVVADAYPSCNFGGVGYSHGSLSCQSGAQYRCSSGTWERLPGAYC
jgi:hypothetical protein